MTSVNCSLKAFIEFSHNKLEKKLEHDYTIISPCQGFYFLGLPAEKCLIWWRLLTCNHPKTKTIQYNYRLRSNFISYGQSLQRNWYWFILLPKLQLCNHIPDVGTLYTNSNNYTPFVTSWIAVARYFTLPDVTPAMLLRKIVVTF